MNKMGRPCVDHPRNKNVCVRFTEEEHKELLEYCEKHNHTITQVVVAAIKEYTARKIV